MIEIAKKHKKYIIDMRRHFHMYPELSMKEFDTSKKIKEELTKMNIPYTSVAETGVMATIEGEKPGKVVALRADMDALELEEKNEVPYKSKNNGIMHGCGHDGHIAMLLGAAKILSEMKSEIKGKVKLLFQPAEETAQGAKKMIQDGVLDDVDAIFGAHLWSELPVGKISVQSGSRMAAVDFFKILVQGKGGHGSMPHQGVDSVVAASSIVMNLQSIVSRELSPMDSAVVTVGKLEAGSRFNVLAQEGALYGTTRYFNPDIKERLPKIIERIAKKTAESFRAKASLEYKYLTPPLINNPRCSEIARGAVEKILGEDGIGNLPKMTGGEDFAFFMEKVPGVMAMIGTRNKEKDTCWPQHHPNYDIDENALISGAAVYAQFALDFLNN